jgi:hypothetical protein
MQASSRDQNSKDEALHAQSLIPYAWDYGYFKLKTLGRATYMYNKGANAYNRILYHHIFTLVFCIALQFGFHVRNCEVNAIVPTISCLFAIRCSATAIYRGWRTNLWLPMIPWR